VDPESARRRPTGRTARRPRPTIAVVDRGSGGPRLKILIIKLAALGDVLRTTTALAGLRERYPGCRIDWVTSPAACDFLQSNPLVDRVFDIDSFTDRSGGPPYDLVVSLDEDHPACALATSLAQHSRLVGAYLHDDQPAYTDDAVGWFDMSRISRHSREIADRKKLENERTFPDLLYEMLGLRYERQEPVLVLTPEAKAFGAAFAAAARLGPEEVVFGVNTGAGARWQDKKLSVPQTVEVIRGLRDVPRARVLLLGGPEEVDRNREIAERAGVPVLRADGRQSALEFAALVDLCKVVVTSDSLALHVALALGKRVVAFFYPTSAAEIELYGRGVKVLGRGASYGSYEQVCRHPPVWDLQAIVEGARSLAVS
jgi:heptosyltransferase-2